MPLAKMKFGTKPINLIFSQDGRYLIVPLIGFGMQRFELKDILNGKTPKDLITQSPILAMGVAVGPDGQHMALGQWEGTILLATGRHTRPVCLEGHASMVFDLTFNANAPRLASISDDQTVRLWNTSSGREILQIKKEGPFSRNIAFSQDGNQLIVNDRTRTLMVFDASPLPESQDRTTFVLEDQRGRVQTVEYSPSGKQVISSGESGVIFWSAQNGEPEHTIDPVRIIGAFNGQFSPDGRWITATFFNSCRVFDAKPPYQEKFSIESNREMYGVAFSYDSRYLIVGGEERILHVYDCRSGEEIGELGNQDDWIVNITASPRGKYLASTGYYRGVRIWDATRLGEWQKGRLIRGGSFGFVGCGFGPDETQLAVGGLNGEIRVLDIESEATVLDIPNAHGGLVHGVTFSHNGKYIASCSADETVRIWDAKTGNPVDVLLGHKGRVLSVDFSPDGTHVVSGGVDGTVRIWTPRLE
jgi:WD40 repeat protein